METGGFMLAWESKRRQRTDGGGDLVRDGYTAFQQSRHHHVGPVGVSGQLLREQSACLAAIAEKPGLHVCLRREKSSLFDLRNLLEFRPVSPNQRSVTAREKKYGGSHYDYAKGAGNGALVAERAGSSFAALVEVPVASCGPV